MMRRHGKFLRTAVGFGAGLAVVIWGGALVIRAMSPGPGAPPQDLRQPAPAPAPEMLARDVFDLVQKHCIECHGAAREAQLDLRSEAGLQKGGRSGPVVVPRDPSASLLYKAVTHDGDLQMPEDAPKLSDEAIRTIRLWIEAGASWASVPAANGGR